MVCVQREDADQSDSMRSESPRSTESLRLLEDRMLLAMWDAWQRLGLSLSDDLHNVLVHRGFHRLDNVSAHRSTT
ncbi:hypothetical protein M3J09_011980 [Ascochyta lentis]